MARVLDMLPVERVEHDVSLQLDLMRIRNVLELTPSRTSARRDTGGVTRCGDGSRTRTTRKDVGPLPIPDRDLHILARDAAFTSIVAPCSSWGKAQSTMDPCVRDDTRGYCSESRVREADG